MADHAEEQLMEAEALEAIFESHFQILTATPNDATTTTWSIDLYPETTSGEEEEEDKNHVAITLIATLPETYPGEALPILDVQIRKGLAEEHRQELLRLAEEEAENNLGIPCLFAIAERLREWLVENNVKGLDDLSMHAQMLRKQKDAEKAKIKAQEAFEAQKKQEDFTEAELEELAVRKRREEGTPCNKENFLAWKERFEEEIMAKKAQDETAAEEQDKTAKKKEKKDQDKAGRMTGFAFFSNKAMNLEALEAAAENAGAEDDEDFDNVDEELFEEDVDLDDLDFEDEDSDDEEEEVDI